MMQLHTLKDRLPLLLLLTGFILTVLLTRWLLRAAGADFVDNYPFMFPDSYDWLTNGLYFLQVFVAGIPDIPPTVRQPLFSLLVALAYWVQHPLWLIGVLQLAAFGTVVVSHALAKELQIRPLFRSLLVCFLLLSHSINTFRFYLMSDGLAIFCTVLSTYCFIVFWNRRSRSSFAFYGSIAGAIGSMAQIFALYPLLVFVFFLAADGLRLRSWRSLSIAAGCVLAPLALQLPWMIFKELHFGSFTYTQVTQFGNIKLSFANWGFYLNTWPVFFAPLLAAIAVILPFVRIRRSQVTGISLQLLATVSAFAFSVFFYRWQESRFTSYFVPLLAIAVFNVLDRVALPRIPSAISAVTAIAVAYLSLVPTNDLMTPQLQQYIATASAPGIVWKTNFVSVAANVKPMSRFSTDPCFLNKENCDNYLYNNMQRYKQVLDLLNKSRRGTVTEAVPQLR